MNLEVFRESGINGFQKIPFISTDSLKNAGERISAIKDGVAVSKFIFQSFDHSRIMIKKTLWNFHVRFQSCNKLPKILKRRIPHPSRTLFFFNFCYYKMLLFILLFSLLYYGFIIICIYY